MATIPKKSQKRNRRKNRKGDRKKTRERNRRILNERKQNLDRIVDRPEPETGQPMMTATNIHYELADRVQGLAAGGIGAIYLLARSTGLVALSTRWSTSSSGTCPTTSRITCSTSRTTCWPAARPGASGTAAQRRSVSRCLRHTADSRPHDGRRLLPAVPQSGTSICWNDQRSPASVWAEQPQAFFEEAIIDGDGTMVETDGECKAGMDINYDGTWGYHPLLISLANTAEPLYLLNRSGNRPTQEHAAFSSIRPLPCVAAPDSARLCSAATPTSRRRSISIAGTKRATLHLRIDACRLYEGLADNLPRANSFLERPPRYEIQTTPRQQPAASRSRSSKSAGSKPSTSSRRRGGVQVSPSRLKGTIAWSWFASVWGSTRDRCGCSRSIATSSISPTTERTAAEIVLKANDRCDQENLIAQLKNGVTFADAAGGRPVQQLGVHGDGQPGLEPEGVGGLDDPGVASTCGQAQGRETVALADGVRDILRGHDPDAMPDHQERAPVDLPIAVVEPMARGLPAIGRAAAGRWLC